MSSDELSDETIRRRARPVKGGTWKCSRCDNNRVPGSAYCRPHKNEFQRGWWRERSDELKKYRQDAVADSCAPYKSMRTT